MSMTTERAATTTDALPLASPPLRDFEPGTQRLVSNEDGTVDIHGWCRDFCAVEGPDNGQTVEEHGLWCESLSTGWVDGVDPEGGRVLLAANLMHAYRHGVYTRSAVSGGDTTFVRVLAEGGDGDDREVYLTPGEALIF